MAAALAISRLHVAEARFLEAQEERRNAILESVRSNVPMREVAEVAHCSHETIRRIVAADGAVTLAFHGQSYLLGRKTVELLIYKLAGNAHGRFAKDVERLQAGDAWLRAAGALADELHAAMAEVDGATVHLDDPRAFALHQVLRFTNKGNPSILSDLGERLGAEYSYPPYDPRALRKWTLPRESVR